MIRILSAAAVLLLLASTAQAADTSKAAAGRLVAERKCGGCHAVAEGPSPLPEAPPFRLLYTRYPKGGGGLDQLLAEGMLPPPQPQEEGRRPGHWRMPTVQMDPDEVASLTAYLRSLEPPPRAR